MIILIDLLFTFLPSILIHIVNFVSNWFNICFDKGSSLWSYTNKSCGFFLCQRNTFYNALTTILSFSDNRDVSSQYEDAKKNLISIINYLQRFSFGLSRHSDFHVWSNLYVWKNRKNSRDMKWRKCTTEQQTQPWIIVIMALLLDSSLSSSFYSDMQSTVTYDMPC